MIHLHLVESLEEPDAYIPATPADAEIMQQYFDIQKIYRVWLLLQVARRQGVRVTFLQDEDKR